MASKCVLIESESQFFIHQTSTSISRVQRAEYLKEVFQNSWKVKSNELLSDASLIRKQTLEEKLTEELPRVRLSSWKLYRRRQACSSYMLTNQRDSQNAREMPQNFYMMESGLCRNSISKLSHRAKTFWKEENHAQLHRESGGEEPEI